MTPHYITVRRFNRVKIAYFIAIVFSAFGIATIWLSGDAVPLWLFKLAATLQILTMVSFFARLLYCCIGKLYSDERYYADPIKEDQDLWP